MEKPINKPVFSLKWKAGLFFGGLVFIFLSSFPLMVNWNMQQRFELFRLEIQQQYQQQLFGQLKTGSEELQRLAEFILAFSPGAVESDKLSDIKQTLSKHRSELELQWNVTQAWIIDFPTQKLGGWGQPLPNTIKALIPLTIKTETAHSYINCYQGCQQYLLLPILSEAETRHVLILGYNISNTLLAFQSQTGADVAVISNDSDEHALRRKDNQIWGKHINALTSFSDNIDFLQQLAKYYNFDNIDQHGLLVRDKRLPVEFQIIKIDNVDDVMLIIIDDIHHQQQAILDVTYRSIVISLLGVILIGGSIFFFLSAPLRRLSSVSRALPLLGQKQYASARKLINPNPEQKHRRLDELDLLEDSSYALSSQLEGMEQAIKERTDSLNLRTVELRDERDFVKNLIDTAQLMIITLDKQCKIISFNKFSEQMTGCSEQDVVGTPIEPFFKTQQWDNVHAILNDLTHTHLAVSQLETDFIHKNGDVRVISWLHSSLTVADGDAVILSVGLDVTDKKRSEEQMLWMANHDALTELYNRRKFNSDFKKLLNQAQRYKREGMLLFLDLDQFKDINDSCGHNVGDQLLQRVAQSLLAISRSTDIVARLGGDEFAIILPETDLHGAITLCEKITDSLKNIDFSHEQARYTISCSIGITKFPLNNLTVDDLVSNADIAMYQAKSKGKNTWHLFTSDDMARTELKARVKWKQKIVDALNHNRFQLFYQPIMHIQSRTVSHYEALLRMWDDNDQLHLPGLFIQVAEQTGLIHRIDHYVLEQGVAKIAEQNLQHQDISLSLNLSGHAVVDPELQPLLEHLITQYGAQADKLIFELTETAAVADIPQARELMQELIRLGCRFSIDDFGTGFASFRYLRELPVSLVKIDGSFITHITENEDDRLFVQALVTIAKGMGKQTIAEFVENAETLALLETLGVDYAQGYYIGKPQPELLSGPPELD